TRTTDVVVRAHAICALGSLPESPEVEEFLKRTLSDTNTAARAAAAWAVGMGRHKDCRAELQKMSESENVTQVKDIARAALTHLDHPIGDNSCCGIESSIWPYVQLGDSRRD